MKYVIDMRTFEVISVELDDTNSADNQLLENIEATIGMELKEVVEEILVSTGVKV